MPGVSKEQIARAKEWDLLSYLQRYEPDELVRTDPHEYSTATHGSLKISNGKWTLVQGKNGRQGRFFLPCTGSRHGFRGGRQATFGRNWRPAAAHCSVCRSAQTFPSARSHTFSCYVLSYLQKRGIGGDIIRACIEASIRFLYRRS